jgi:GTP-binding protein
MAHLPIVAIVGRPNVGKSTLFNRVAQERIAIVEDKPGVTRDRLMTRCRWLEHQFLLVDTGGITAGDDPLIGQVKIQAKLAIDEADIIVFLVDGREGLHPDDEEVADMLRRARRPVILGVNKVDRFGQEHGAEFYRFGFGDPVLFSAEHGLNIGDLLDRVVAEFGEEVEHVEGDAIRVAVVGRPNVGKSSLVNALLGQERMIVSDIPGTTRDAIDTLLRQDDQEYLLVDTAGIRRKSKIEESVEYYSVLRTVRAMERADVALIMMDATDFLTEQDRRVAGMVQEVEKACVLLVNKWDIRDKQGLTTKEMEDIIRHELPSLHYAPILFISAKTRQRLNRILPMVNAVANEYAHRIPTRTLNELLQEAISVHHPPARKGKELKIFYISQVQVRPPTFAIWLNDPELMHFSYQRYLENRIRESFSFQGTPIRWVLKRRNPRQEQKMSLNKE